MARQLIEFSTRDGETVLVESVDMVARGEVTRGRQQSALVERAQATLDDALRRIQPAVEGVLASTRGAIDPPQHLQIEFGIAMSAEAGAFIAAASTSANFRVTLTWQREEASS